MAEPLHRREAAAERDFRVLGRARGEVVAARAGLPNANASASWVTM